MGTNVYVGTAVTSHADAVLCQANFASVGLSGGAVDTDADGMTDAAETAAGLDPTDADQDVNGIPDGRDDWDGDGADNQAELVAGTPPGSWVPAGGDDDDGGAWWKKRCGLLGAEALAVLALLGVASARLRRRR